MQDERTIEQIMKNYIAAIDCLLNDNLFRVHILKLVESVVGTVKALRGAGFGP